MSSVPERAPTTDRRTGSVDEVVDDVAEPAAVPVRGATAADVPEIVRLRRVMFEAMVDHPLVPGSAWESRCAEVIREGLARGDVFAFVIDEPDAHLEGTEPFDRAGGRLVASVVVEVQQRFPSPWSPEGTLGYLSSVATDDEHRSQGFGRAVVAAAVAECERRGIERVELHASPMGAPLYRSLGFDDRPGGHELRLRRD